MTAIVTGGQDWTLEKIDAVYSELDKIWKEKYNISLYPNHIEMITAEQMLDAHCAVAMPIMYNHWTFGESFIRSQSLYKRGLMGLAYEVVLNSNPCKAYLMEENTMLAQTLVTAHACFGHNAFMKNNYLFKQWTDASFILDYLEFAKNYIRQCEEKYGIDEVEEILDACHSLKYYGLDKYKRPTKLTKEEEEKLRKERDAYNQSQVNEMWNNMPKAATTNEPVVENFLKEPEENILYFLEKYAPRLDEWKREIIRIVRKISQYFYPQMQCQLMNEGCATYFHYKLTRDLYDRGIINDGAYQEFMIMHTGVITQYDGSDINVYALGFAMYNDIERIAMNPTPEDRNWFGDQWWVGCGDYMKVINHVIEDYKDESFVLQFLSPKVIRDFKFFSLHDDAAADYMEVTAIHNNKGYKEIRENIAKHYNIGYKLPDIQIVNVDIWHDRTMILVHTMVEDKPLAKESAINTVQNLQFLWGYDVKLMSINSKKDIEEII
jgi:stage V sporulation protein R